MSDEALAAAVLHRLGTEVCWYTGLPTIRERIEDDDDRIRLSKMSDLDITFNSMAVLKHNLATTDHIIPKTHFGYTWMPMLIKRYLQVRCGSFVNSILGDAPFYVRMIFKRWCRRYFKGRTHIGRDDVQLLKDVRDRLFIKFSYGGCSAWSRRTSTIHGKKIAFFSTANPYTKISSELIDHRNRYEKFIIAKSEYYMLKHATLSLALSELELDFPLDREWTQLTDVINARLHTPMRGLAVASWVSLNPLRKRTRESGRLWDHQIDGNPSVCFLEADHDMNMIA